VRGEGVPLAPVLLECTLRLTPFDAAPTVATMRTTADSPRIAYDVVGSEGPPVLLLMGFGMRGDMWQPQIEGLGADHRLVYLDNRGVGESECPPGPWRMADLADDARRVLDDVGWERAHVVGVSMGGMIAQELALTHPDRCVSLSLIATHAGGPLRWLPSLQGIRCFLRAQTGKPEHRLRALQDLLYPPHFVAQYDSKQLAHRMRRAGRRAPMTSLRAQLDAVMRHDTRKRLHRLRMPTLVVRPGMDILIKPSACDQLVGCLPHARVLRLDDAGHGAIFQSARAVNDALRRHFAEAAPLADRSAEVA
jgi:3-oxoadipate enol-lactonase